MTHAICPACEIESVCRRVQHCTPLLTRNGGRVIDTSLPIDFAGNEPMPTPEEAMGWLWWAVIALAAILLVVLVVGLPLYFGGRP